VVRRGQPVYSLDGAPVPLFYGAVTPYRSLDLGVTGADVAELPANRDALGFGHGLSSDGRFDAATAAAVRAWQSSLGVPATGVVDLGDVVVAPGPIEIATVSANDGDAATAGLAVLTATSTTPVVTIDLDAAQQSQVTVGDAVTITLPDNSTTPGVVSSVGTIATTPSGSGQNGGSSSPTITVEVTPTDLRATSGIDQAPVNVSITEQSVSNALVVPVDALLALAGGGYAVEVISRAVHHLVPVSVGIFDDAAGLVQVSGQGLETGQRVVVPGT
ncbi:MAG TPA: peptidoglycan-binding protein, partial [Acidimicrobiales bacterium]|nr:peptidoglycan-binding protein [Acidimicrobiales bacterium]